MMSNYLIKALEKCEEALQNPTENRSQWELNCRKVGNILQSMGWFNDALIWHSRLLESHHNLVEIYKDLAILYTRLEKWEDAIATYKKILELKPEDGEIYLNLSKIYQHLGDQDQENECLFQVLTLQPKKVKPEGYYKLGQEFQKLGHNQRAITCYLRSIENNPQLLNAYYDLATTYVLEGDWEKAINIYKQLLAQDEKQHLAHYNIGQLLWEQEFYSEAINSLIKAAFLEPKLAEFYFNFAKILIEKEQLEEVMNFCSSLLRAKIAHPWTYIQLGNVLAKKGQTQEASLCYRQASKLRGWEDCVIKNYQFSKDFFNYKIEIFKKYLSNLVNQPLIQALELGCQEGMSSCWLLDNILTEATAKFTCVDAQFSDLFKVNIVKTGATEKVTQLEGYPVTILKGLAPQSFDLINIQDKVKKPLRVKEITQICWQLTKKGGLIIFNDYTWQPPYKSEEETPQQVIDSFLASKENQCQIIYQGQQLIIKKLR